SPSRNFLTFPKCFIGPNRFVQISANWLLIRVFDPSITITAALLSHINFHTSKLPLTSVF
ncbi:hypothetical protein O181_063363, partial [Austropuccinia psidii MF-1]|nr:hypothetical protein [Austropuccinia psidii MF-1]